MAQGIPRRYTNCPCGSEYGLPNVGKCRTCINRAALERYHFTPERDERIRQTWNLVEGKNALTAAIGKLAGDFDIPRRAIVARAAKLGASRRVSRWTQADTAFLRANAGIMSAREIESALGHSHHTVRMYAVRLKLSLKAWQGYGRVDVARLMGVGLNTVTQWNERGWLQKDAEGKYSQAEIERLLRNHICDVEIRQADQAWLRETLQRMLSAPGGDDRRAYDDIASEGRATKYTPAGYGGFMAADAMAKRQQREAITA